MPGRPKKERERHDGEKKKKPPQGKLSKKGTTIRCRVCKGIGHNRTTCSRRTCSGTASGGASLSGNASGGASQSSNASGGASQSVREEVMVLHSLVEEAHQKGSHALHLLLLVAKDTAM